jgi:hypothetical protein
MNTRGERKSPKTQYGRIETLARTMEINHVKGSLLKSYFHSLAGVFHRKGALRVKNVQELKSRVYMMISQK